MNEQFDYSVVENIIQEHGAKQSSIIAILQAVQEHYRYVPKEVFSYMAKRMGLSSANIYSVATFYENFSLEPKGKYVIKVCDGTACHVRNSPPILAKLKELLDLSDTKHTTDDLLFTLETVSCLGACGLAPVLTVNDKVYPSMTPEKAEALLNQLKEEAKC